MSTKQFIYSRVIALAVFICLIASAQHSTAQVAQSKDGMFSLAVPPGWMPAQQPNVELSYNFPGPEPLIMYMVSEKKSQRDVLNDIRVAADDVKTQPFTTGTGAAGTKISVRQPLSTPDTFIYQFYYLFSYKRATYALVFVSGICNSANSPERMFDAIASSVSIGKRKR